MMDLDLDIALVAAAAFAQNALAAALIYVGPNGETKLITDLKHKDPNPSDTHPGFNLIGVAAVFQSDEGHGELKVRTVDVDETSKRIVLSESFNYAKTLVAAGLVTGIHSGPIQ